jgi:hypothetical protein
LNCLDPSNVYPVHAMELILYHSPIRFVIKEALAFTSGIP